MKQNPFKSILTILITLLFVLLSNSYYRHSKNWNDKFSSQNETAIKGTRHLAGGEGGGIDGSGGNTIFSTKEDISQALNKVKVDLPALIDELYREKTYNTLFDEKARLFIDRFYAHTPTAVYADEILANVKINLQDLPCSSREGQRAGSALGNLQNGEICLSAEKLKMIPTDSLSDEMTALLFHELSHLVGFNEEEALSLQKFALDKYLTKKALFSNPSIVYDDITCRSEQERISARVLLNSLGQRILVSDLSVGEKIIKLNEVKKFVLNDSTLFIQTPGLEIKATIPAAARNNHIGLREGTLSINGKIQNIGCSVPETADLN